MTWQNKFTSLKLNEKDALPELAISLLSSWKVITVSGEDKKSYLQGQLTCDVVTLADSESTLGAHCDAKGKVWSTFRLFNHKDTYALFQHGSGIEKSLAEIKKYSVFSKVEIEISDAVILGITGTESTAFINQNTETQGSVRTFGNGTAVKVDDKQWLLIIEEQEAESIVANFEGTLASEDLWDLYDIQAAIPRVTEAQQNVHIPQALNLHLVGGVSFSKGCYTGQETVARAKYRGTNKRAMYLVKGHSRDTLTGTDELERNVGENWRSAGELLAGYQFADNAIYGLIVLPNNLEPDTQFRLTSDPDSRFSLVPMPYSLEDPEA
ncbi:tRNA-modifying protein YgfZ [Vibrio hannami]|uniref:tRNA-modifying protein YgfZ n=1 Tax=Vibrio hannami TaxID=2717094 RepID=UPI00240F88C2|nr:tRNA-modifying protein YgfZ [Vibrio hannami]MDG3087143.1 tRNA-modifying protein YgfZ [Vibrio hannami]